MSTGRLVSMDRLGAVAREWSCSPAYLNDTDALAELPEEIGGWFRGVRNLEEFVRVFLGREEHNHRIFECEICSFLGELVVVLMRVRRYAGSSDLEQDACVYRPSLVRLLRAHGGISVFLCHDCRAELAGRLAETEVPLVAAPA